MGDHLSELVQGGAEAEQREPPPRSAGIDRQRQLGGEDFLLAAWREAVEEEQQCVRQQRTKVRVRRRQQFAQARQRGEKAVLGGQWQGHGARSAELQIEAAVPGRMPDFVERQRPSAIKRHGKNRVLRGVDSHVVEGKADPALIEQHVDQSVDAIVQGNGKYRRLLARWHDAGDNQAADHDMRCQGKHTPPGVVNEDARYDSSRQSPDTRLLRYTVICIVWA
ncbi:MAG: hypothetical protein AW08_03790 [Candidatus Accumulibacter adjunctus]|uniref:Uncharacterized protein n=1 Tax=Candidatus Accumulibacter adjunctus TaxID=1454001 RepID=A0A011NIJ2_9PROT|nr:MAG: hypothetical protein AW08_03790 [Candidatus Accumulibacter adjunctus]